MLDFSLIVVSLIIIGGAYGGWYVKSLTTSGSIAAVIVGLLIYQAFSYQGLLLLGCFFCSSSYLSKYRLERKIGMQDILVKGERRDMIQVFANGGVPTILSILQIISENTNHVYLLCFCMAIAAANADTWASEIGTLSKQKPRLLLTFKRVERGTSGAVSLLGTGASIAGAAFISIIAVLLFDLTLSSMLLIVSIGFIGNILDTFIGQTIQNKYSCTVCEKVTERPYHCSKRGVKTTYYSFLNNDAVNFLSIALSTYLGYLILT